MQNRPATISRGRTPGFWRIRPGSAAAWRGEELAARDDWRFRLDSTALAELDAALVAADATGKPNESLTRDDFPLPTLGSAIAQWRDALARGRGFQVVSGIPSIATRKRRWSVSTGGWGSTSVGPARRTSTAICSVT